MIAHRWSLAQSSTLARSLNDDDAAADVSWLLTVIERATTLTT